MWTPPEIEEADTDFGSAYGHADSRNSTGKEGTEMKPRPIKDGIYWVGAVDWDRRLFDSEG